MLWLWGESETWSVAEETWITKRTLTCVAHTLESRGLVERLFPAFHDEEVFVASRLGADEEYLRLADGPRAVVAQLEEYGEERRQELLGGAEPAPRRSGRRPRT
ncbi:hypothetical protein [Streptomyces sp. BK340]|uniref:hypothetical protein n=1 Tax=Streptomyces sp. BK340 TaxID=2572903 RepID=UPI0037D9EE3A